MEPLGTNLSDQERETVILEKSPASSKSDVKSQRIHWFFTFFEYSESDLRELCEFCKFKCKESLFQEEKCPTTGRMHLQGSITLKKRARWSEFGLSKKIHWEKTHHLESSINYCQKTYTRAGRQFKNGIEIIPIKTITTLYKWQSEIEDIYLQEIDDRKIFWFWENTGNIGKSAFCKYMILKYNCLFCSGGKYSDIMNLVFNQDMTACRAVIFDIPRAHKGAISYASLESIKNGLVCNTKYETGVKIFNPPHIFIFANFEPDDPEQLSEDRWVITNLDQNSAT